MPCLIRKHKAVKLMGDRCSELYNRLPGPGNKGIRTTCREKQCVCERGTERQREGERTRKQQIYRQLHSVPWVWELFIFLFHLSYLELVCVPCEILFSIDFFLKSTRLFSKNSCLLPRVVGLGEKKDELNHRLRTQHQSHSYSVTVCVKRES